jgi:transposase-like protein
MASSVRPLTSLTLEDLWREVKDPRTLWGDISQETQRRVKFLLENRMNEEVLHYLRAPRYARLPGRRGYRNGVYRRQLTTTWGTIPDLEVPRVRRGTFTPAVLERYQRRTREVDTLIRRVFLGGVSTRQVGPLLASLLGDHVSPATVSRITRALDRAVQAYHRRPLTDRYRYLLLDGVTLRVKTPDGAKRRTALVAYGITPEGRRELIDFRLVRTESQGTWEAFLTNLACRGLTGAGLHLITTDGHVGLHAALALVYPQVPRQTCWVHVLRNVAQHLRVRDREPCLALARQIYQAPTREAAETRLWRWVAAWKTRAPQAVQTLLRDWEALLAFYGVPEPDWRRVRTTNAIERAFREIRRRVRPMSCFTNLASCDRITYAVISGLNNRWGIRARSKALTQSS